jgi:hypothetical protein
MRHYENEPRLAICKYADIVPVRATLSELRDLFEHLRLRRSWLEDLHARSDEEVIGGFNTYSVECEVPVLFAFSAGSAFANRR